MVLLQMKTDNITNTTLAKFDSVYDKSFIQFSDINSNIYLSGIANNSFKIYNSNNLADNGMMYNNNQLSVRSINGQIFKSNDYTVFPNDFTPLSDYEFNELNPINTNRFANCFDPSATGSWISANIYSPFNGKTPFDITKPQIDPYNFYNSGSRGYWATIKFPYQIIPSGISFSSRSSIILTDPNFFDLFGSNDGIIWTRIYSFFNPGDGNTFYFINTVLYLYVGIVITEIRGGGSSQLSFIINKIKIYSLPILHLDSRVKISNNYLYNLDTISINKLILNNTVINSSNDLKTDIIDATLQTIIDTYNIYWKNKGTVGYLNSNIVRKIAINSSNANSYLDINGDISYNQKSINSYIHVTNLNNSPQSSYVYIGKIRFKNNTKNYFKLSLCLIELDKYYFQTVDIEGYYSTNINIYWKTAFDNSVAIQRIVNIHYKIDRTDTNNTYVSLYCKYNSILNITSFVTSIQILQNYDYVNNFIYIDATNTSSITDIEFLIKNPDNNPANKDGDNDYLNTTLITAMNLNNNSYINLYASNINFTNNNFNTSNILITDNSKTITDSGVNINTLFGISRLTPTPNKVVGTNNLGILNYLDIPASLLNNINYNTQLNSQILITSNNLFKSVPINSNNLSNLNSIHTIPNSIVIINNNNELKTTTSVAVNNLSNVLRLFNFSVNNSTVYCQSNMYFNNILFGNKHTINSNYIFNRISVNNREIADDIFKLIVRTPNYSDILDNDGKLLIAQSLNNTTPNKYGVIYNNSSYSIYIEIDVADVNGDANKLPVNLFDSVTSISTETYWQSSANFANGTFKAYRSLYDDNSFTDIVLKKTGCGAYLIFDLQVDFVLHFYSIYVNYSSTINLVKSFNLFGYNNNTNVWDLIDTRNNIVWNNNYTPNIFTIKKNNFNYYSKYGLCITSSYNITTIPTPIILHRIFFFGYPIVNNLFSYSNLIPYNNENNYSLLGFNNIGISNVDPFVPLSIGVDIPSNPKNGMININHPSFIHISNEIPMIALTRPSSNLTIGGIKATHYINNWNNSNTNYTIKLTHSNILREKVVLSMNSTGNVAIGGYPNSNLNNNGLSFYDNSNRFVNIYASNLSSNYSIILPTYAGTSNMLLYVDYNLSNNVQLKFNSPSSFFSSQSNIDFNAIRFMSNNSNITIKSDKITSNYSIFLPTSFGTSNSTFTIDKIVNTSNLYLKFEDPISRMSKLSNVDLNAIRFTSNDSNITIRTQLISSNYSIFLPQTVGNVNNSFIIDTIDNCNVYLKFDNPVSSYISDLSNIDLKAIRFTSNDSNITIRTQLISSNYSIFLPSTVGNVNNAFIIDTIDNCNVYLKFDDPISNLSKRSNIDLNAIRFTSNDSNITIGTHLISSNYSIFLPSTVGNVNNSFIIDTIDNSNVYLKFNNPVSNLISTTYIKIGDDTITNRKEATVQIAGKCLIGNNTNGIIDSINSDYFSNSLIVNGSIYATQDIHNDSDISYKYNIRPIEDPLLKINKISGYTFNRYDTNDDNRYSGLIAQEVIKVMPEVITIKPDGKYRIIYTNLSGLFVEAIKKIDKKADYINFKLNCFICIIGITCLYLYSRR